MMIDEQPVMAVSVKEMQKARRRNLSIRVTEVALIIFFMGSIIFEIPELEGLLTMVKAFGIMFALLGFHNIQFHPLSPTAKKIFTYQSAFLAWLLLTGIFVSLDYELFWGAYRAVLQGVALSFGVSTYIVLKRKEELIFVSYALVTILLAYYSYSLGEFSVGSLLREGKRATSILANPNYLGVLAVYGMFAIAYLWHHIKKRYRLLLLIPAGMDLALIVISASRKAFLAMTIFAVLYLILCNTGVGGKKVRLLFGMVFLVVSMSYLMDYVRENTYLGKRWERLETNEDLGEGRESLIDEGWKRTLESPIIGIGLGNFQKVSSEGQVTHSDYMEVLVSSGFPGLLLYLIPYFILLRRILRIRRTTTDPDAKFLMGLFLAILITTWVNGTSFMNFVSYSHWIMFSAILGATEYLDETSPQSPSLQPRTDLRARRLVPPGARA